MKQASSQSRDEVRRRQTQRAPIRLGPFELHSPIGQGGMGEVWRGVHPGQRLPVAVKVITAVQAREAGYQTAFRNEVQAMAGLDHPGLILVFDHGEVSAPAARASRARLHAGSPYVVMELLTGGRLDKLPPPPDWERLRALLGTLLGALSHAHARGVVHRDLKLSNVLLAGPDDVRPGYRIIDFGLAAVDLQEGGVPHELSAGTPAFEAPEQILGQWRDQGPWTDLYALGCMAYALASGDPPFTGEDIERIHRCHLMVPMPPLQNRYAVPQGFEGWLARLLAKHPSDRFGSAAEALHGLESLGAAPACVWREPRLPVPSSTPPAGRDSLARTHNEAVTRQTRRKVASPIEAGFALGRLMELSDTEEPMAVRQPPLPADWREPESGHTHRSPRLVGAGLGLYGLRAIPMVDREPERDLLWAQLRDVRRDGRARLVLLRGSAGTGKSRLAEWLAERAHELAGAVTLRAMHSRIEGPHDGLRRMVAQHLGCVGLTHGDALTRIESLLRERAVEDPYEWHALTELILPAASAELERGTRPVAFANPRARYALVRRLLERAAARRPVVVWLDDIQWGLDALVFAKHVMADQVRHPCPVLIVVTTQNEALVEEPRTSRLFSEIAELPRVTTLEVGPFDGQARVDLVSALLGLEGELAEWVAARTGGNPLFAVQLLGDWVERGLLEVGEDGFVLRSRDLTPLPDDLHEVWRNRLDRLLGGLGPHARALLELAAALGRDIDLEELEATASGAGLEVDKGLIEALVTARLARPTVGGMGFVHGMLRESIERVAREGGRWAGLNQRCADMLERLYEPEVPGLAARLGRHRLEAGELERAVGPLLTGASEHYARSEFLSALFLLEAREDALQALGVPADDPTWGDGWVLRARVHLFQGQFERALDWARRVESNARARGWAALLPSALRSMAYGVQQQGDLMGASRLYEQARLSYDEQGSREGVGACLHGLGEVARLRGETEKAARLNERALALFEEVDDVIGQAKCLRGLGVITQHRGDFAGAVQLYTGALEQYRSVSNPYGMAICINDLAEVKRWQGDLEGAEADYRRALAIYEAIGSQDGVITQLNLGLVLMTRGHWAEAREQLLEGSVELERGGRLGFLGGTHAALLACAARAHDWDALEVHLERAASLLESTALVDADIAWPARLAGDLAAEAKRPEQAAAAYHIALAQYRALDEHESAGRVMEKLAAIGYPVPAA